MLCRHEQTEFGEVIGRDGRSQVEERCVLCRQNVRGAGVWVARATLPTPGKLPVFRDMRKKPPPGNSLFGEDE
jgi:hypothetical protein